MVKGAVLSEFSSCMTKSHTVFARPARTKDQARGPGRRTARGSVTREASLNDGRCSSIVPSVLPCRRKRQQYRQQSSIMLLPSPSDAVAEPDRFHVQVRSSRQACRCHLARSRVDAEAGGCRSTCVDLEDRRAASPATVPPALHAEFLHARPAPLPACEQPFRLPSARSAISPAKAAGVEIMAATPGLPALDFMRPPTRVPFNGMVRAKVCHG